MNSGLDILKNISYTTRKCCAICQRRLGKPVVELSSLPLTEIYTRQCIAKEDSLGIVDQNLHLCQQCGHAQLSNVIDVQTLYGDVYSFRTAKSMSRKGNDTFINFIEQVTEKKRFSTILEIGCNDTYLLNALADQADNLIGIDPTLKGSEKELYTEKVKVIGELFEDVHPEEYRCSGSVLVLSSHTLEHIANPKELIQKLIRQLSGNPLFIFQFPGFDGLVDDCRFDQIYHHHLHYFSLYSFTYLLKELDCELIAYDINYHYFNSLMIAFRKAPTKTGKKGTALLPAKITAEKIYTNYELFKNIMRSANQYLQTLKGEKAYGYGAGLQLPVLCYHLKNDFSFLECIIDDNRDKDGLYYLNLPVVIRHSSKVNNLKEAIIVITGVNFARNIFGRIIALSPKRVVLPINIM